MVTEEEFETLIKQLRHKMNTQKGHQVYQSAAVGDSIDNFVNDRDNHMSFRLESRKSIYLKKLQNALDKIKNGSFGVCEECDGPIEKSRLKARPTASYCISCKEEQEREEGHKLYQKKSHTMGKTFSYGNVIEFPKDEGNDKILPFKKEKKFQ